MRKMLRQVVWAVSVAVATGFCLGTVWGQSPQSKPLTLQQTLAQKMRELGSCQANLLGLQAEMVDGNLLTLQAFKMKMEDANPTYSLDPVTLKITIRP